MRAFLIFILTLIICICDLKAQITYNSDYPIYFEPQSPCDSSYLYFQTDTFGLSQSADFKWYYNGTLVHAGNMTSQGIVPVGWRDSLWLYPLQYIGATYPGWNDLRLVVSDTLDPFVNYFVSDTTISIYVDTNCINNFIGWAYYDFNKNGLKDSLDLPVNNGLIELSDGKSKTYRFTNPNGKYSFFLPIGSYKLNMIISSLYYFTQPSIGFGYNIVINGNKVDSVGNDFGIYTDSVILDLKVDLNTSIFRPGFNSTVYAIIKNIGTVSDSALVKLSLDSNLSFLNSSPNYDSTSGNDYFFSLGEIQPNSIERIWIQTNLDSTFNIGSSIRTESSVYPFIGDKYPNNNFDTINSIVIGSFDPNDKIVEPFDDSINMVFPEELLNYTIRFQNTGNYYADKVRIVDNIESNLDLNSIEILAASHDYSFRIDSLNDKIVFIFDSIMLPWDKFNEPESHGFVKFQIMLDSNITIGDSVSNAAEIYFDFNAPILTDTVVSKVDTILSNVSLEKFTRSRNFNLFPNPSTRKFKISGIENSTTSFLLYDLLGNQHNVQYKQEGENLIVDTSELAPGLYILKVSEAEMTFTRKVLIER